MRNPGRVGTQARGEQSSLLVRFEPATPRAAREAVLELVGGEMVREFVTVPGLMHVRVAISAGAAAEMLSGVNGVRYAEPDGVVHLLKRPNDPSFREQWGLHNTGQTVNDDDGKNDADIDAPEAWDIFTGDPNMVIAVVDTGVAYNNADLVTNRWINPGEIAGNKKDDDGNGYVDDIRGWDFYNEDADPWDDHGHGTFCAGVIGATGSNGRGITGINWRCKIMPLKFISKEGIGLISGAIGSIDYAVANGARISNHSWGGYEYFQSLADAISAAQEAGHLLVAAAGNDANNNDEVPFYPASYDHENVIAVGGIDNDDVFAWFSHYGVVSVDLVAPAVNVYSLWSPDYLYGTGTSAAAPHVAGVAALVLGLNPDWDYLQVRERILGSVRPIAGLEEYVATGGMLNAARALRRQPRRSDSFAID